MPTPRHEPTEKDRNTVRTMYAYGIAEEAIAKVLKVDPKTLRKHYREELDAALPEFQRLVVHRLSLFALGKVEGALPADSLRACMFVAKTRFGFRETDRRELTGPDGEKLDTAPVVIRLSRDDQEL
jgi:hypothetical protein